MSQLQGQYGNAYTFPTYELHQQNQIVSDRVLHEEVAFIVAFVMSLLQLSCHDYLQPGK
ncbi:hypothetical protein RintRC_1132 [Richelia intracellularis]|nr:hypothetical protein RintRC_1132 [Richelia intracellularis]